MARAFVSIGSNIDREKNYLEALRRLGRLGEIVAVSSVYDTLPIGGDPHAHFFNGAALLDTNLSPYDLKRALRGFEAEMGRTRTGDPNAPRTIDLDLVAYNQDQIEDNGLKIPDPEILRRPFLTHALAELDPNYYFPLTGQTFEEMAQRFGPTPAGMRLDAAMTAKAKNMAHQIHAGENYHA